MIPTTTYTEKPIVDFQLKYERDYPTKTYHMKLEKERVYGNTDGLEAMKQVIFKIVNTERYLYKKVYSDNYGIELLDLYGKPMHYVIPMVQERIKEALLWDERIKAVTDFSVEQNKRALLVRYTAKTIYGDLKDLELQVNV